MNNPSLKIAVCGAGTMGSGIAQVFAMHGFEVILFDVDINTLNNSKTKITEALQLLTGKKKISEAEKEESFNRISFSNEIKNCRAGLIIEAIIENAAVKADLINKLSVINPATTIFATNTSSLSVTAIAEKILRPEMLVGMHFFNPAPLMKLVEIVKTKYTTEEVVKTISETVKQISKTAVICKDSPGFIVNRVARPYYLEALYLYEQSKTPIETIDTLMESVGFKMGPFKLMDLIGNDINYSVSCIVHEALGSPARLKPSPVQQEKVSQGKLGRKTGKGYYDYPEQ